MLAYLKKHEKDLSEALGKEGMKSLRAIVESDIESSNVHTNMGREDFLKRLFMKIAENVPTNEKIIGILGSWHTVKEEHDQNYERLGPFLQRKFNGDVYSIDIECYEGSFYPAACDNGQRILRPLRSSVEDLLSPAQDIFMELKSPYLYYNHACSSVGVTLYDAIMLLRRVTPARRPFISQPTGSSA